MNGYLFPCIQIIFFVWYNCITETFRHFIVLMTKLYLEKCIENKINIKQILILYTCKMYAN